MQTENQLEQYYYYRGYRPEIWRCECQLHLQLEFFSTYILVEFFWKYVDFWMKATAKFLKLSMRCIDYNNKVVQYCTYDTVWPTLGAQDNT